MFDKVWNEEYNEYAVDSRIIGVETLYSIEYTCWKVLEEKALLSLVLNISIYVVQHCLHVWPEERVWGSEEWNVEPVVPRAVKSAYAFH